MAETGKAVFQKFFGRRHAAKGRKSGPISSVTNSQSSGQSRLSLGTPEPPPSTSFSEPQQTASKRRSSIIRRSLRPLTSYSFDTKHCHSDASSNAKWGECFSPLGFSHMNRPAGREGSSRLGKEILKYLRSPFTAHQTGFYSSIDRIHSGTPESPFCDSYSFWENETGDSCLRESCHLDTADVCCCTPPAGGQKTELGDPPIIRRSPKDVSTWIVNRPSGLSSRRCGSAQTLQDRSPRGISLGFDVSDEQDVGTALRSAKLAPRGVSARGNPLHSKNGDEDGEIFEQVPAKLAVWPTSLSDCGHYSQASRGLDTRSQITFKSGDLGDFQKARELSYIRTRSELAVMPSGSVLEATELMSGFLGVLIPISRSRRKSDHGSSFSCAAATYLSKVKVFKKRFFVLMKSGELFYRKNLSDPLSRRCDTRWLKSTSFVSVSEEYSRRGRAVFRLGAPDEEPWTLEARDEKDMRLWMSSIREFVVKFRRRGVDRVPMNTKGSQRSGPMQI